MSRAVPAEPRVMIENAVGDFPDHFSPILVKELRQALRSPAFVISFLALHGVIGGGFLLEMILSGPDSGSLRMTVDAILLAAVILPMVVLFPGRALFSVRSEVSSQALDLLQLTSLSPFRIIVAKWSSIFSQAALYMLSLLPYAALRYFFGGVDLVPSAWFLFAMLVVCGVSSAIAMVFSGAHLLILMLGGVILLVAGQIVTWMFVAILLGGGAGAMPETAIMIPSVLAIGAMMILVCLFLGAERIAPRAIRYQGALRLVPLLTLLPILSSFFFSGREREFLWAFGLAAYFVLTIGTLLLQVLVPFQPIRANLDAFRRRGRIGRLAAWFLAPGDLSAALWMPVTAAAIALATCGGISWNRTPFGSQMWEEAALIAGFALLVFAALLSSRAFALLFPKRFHANPWIPLGFLVGSAVIGVAALASTEGRPDQGLLIALVWNPVAFLIASLARMGRTEYRELISLIGAATFLATFLIIYLRSLPRLRFLKRSIHDAHS